MLEIKTSPRSVIRCNPENEQKYLIATAKALKGRYHPKGSPRKYPPMWGWKTTAEYIEAYEKINYPSVKLVPVKYNCPNIDKPAPMLDPMFPEVIEQPNDD